MSNGLALVLHLYHFEHDVLSIFEEILSCFTSIILRERKKNYAHDPHLYLFELIKSNILKIRSKVIDIQEG